VTKRTNAAVRGPHCAVGRDVADFCGIFQQMADAWSGSMGPFMLGRLMEKPAGFAAGNEMSEAIEKMAQGPRLADVWDIDRKMALVFGAWMEMRQKPVGLQRRDVGAVERGLKAVRGRNVRDGKRGKTRCELARSLREMERDFQRRADPKPAYRQLLAGAEGIAAGGTEAAQPAGRRRRGRFGHVRVAEPEGFRRRDAPAHRTQAGGSCAQPSSQCKEA